MERTSRNPLSGMVVALRAARRQPRDQAARTTGGDPNGLMDILQNTDFLPAELREDGAVLNENDDIYDDLPPLEDAGPSTSRAARTTQRSQSPVSATASSSDSEDDLPALDSPSPSSSPRLSTLDVPLPNPRVAAGDIPASSPSVREAAHADAALLSSSLSGPSLPSEGSPRTRSGRHRATSSSHAATMPEDDDTGAESDSSMPTLRTVSDSSDDEEEDVASESDWDDTDEFYTSDDFDDDNEDAHPPSNSPESNLRRPALFDLLPNFASNMTANRDDLFQSFREMLERASSVPDVGELRGHDDADPSRAEVILGGLEKVPTGLLRRYEQLRAAEGEDGDGCAICREDLCDGEEPAVLVADIVSLYAVLPFHPEENDVLAFPCVGKHLFHGDCISPWLARKTTCPSCRFDIDPHSLTLRRNRQGPDAGLDSLGRRTRVWRPPQVESMSDWLDAEERARASGVPRTRPQPIMPIPGPAPAGSHAFTSSAAGVSLAAGLAAAGTTRTLAELLDSPAPDWQYDPSTGTIDILAAYRSISDMRQAYLEADTVERQRLESLFRRQDAAAPPVQVPERSPSAPPILLGEVTPGLLAPRGPSPALPSGAARSPMRPRTLADQLEHAIIGNAQPPSAGVRLPAAVVEHITRERHAGRAVAIVMPPPVEDREPGLIDLLVHFNERLRAMHVNSPPQGAFPATPASFEDVAHGLQPVHEVFGPLPTAGEAGEAADAFDAADVPPPIQADPNQALHAVAPLALEEEYMHALLAAGLVVPEAGDAAPPAGNDWLEDLD